jgi:hypothetical protein
VNSEDGVPQSVLNGASALDLDVWSASPSACLHIITLGRDGTDLEDSLLARSSEWPTQPLDLRRARPQGCVASTFVRLQTAGKSHLRVGDHGALTQVVQRACADYLLLRPQPRRGAPETRVRRVGVETAEASVVWRLAKSFSRTTPIKRSASGLPFRAIATRMAGHAPGISSTACRQAKSASACSMFSTTPMLVSTIALRVTQDLRVAIWVTPQTLRINHVTPRANR